jgi:hypothetical protein
MSEPNWVDVVGFQIERVHTGVLYELLKNRDTAGAVLKGIVKGLKPDSHIEVNVETLMREAHAGGGPKTRADLVAEISIDGAAYESLVIETKVDSNCEREQLENEAREETKCVLLAVGITGMQWRKPESALPENWSFVDANKWRQALAEVSELPEVFEDYCARLDVEIEMQHAALRSANGEASPADEALIEGDPRGPQMVEWAWLSEVRCGLGEDNRDFGKNEAHETRVVFLIDTWLGVHGYPGMHHWIDLLVENGKRMLVLKADGGSREERLRVWEMLGADSEQRGFKRGSRPRRNSGGSFRVASLTFPECETPSAASAKLSNVIQWSNCWSPTD